MNGVVYDNAINISPSNTLDLPAIIDAIYVGGGGAVNVAVLTPGGQTVSLTGVLTGYVYPIRAKRVLATGTSATALVGLW